MILKPPAPFPPTSKNMKIMIVLYISYVSGANSSFLGTSKTMKMITVLCISDDAAASRPTPTHFQNHENTDSPMHFL